VELFRSYPTSRRLGGLLVQILVHLPALTCSELRLRAILTKFAAFKKISSRIVGQFGCGTRILRVYSPAGRPCRLFTCITGLIVIELRFPT